MNEAEFNENELIANMKAARQPSSPVAHAALSQGGGTLANIASSVLISLFTICHYIGKYCSGLAHEILT